MSTSPQEYRQRLLARYAAQADDLRRAVERRTATSVHLPLETGGWSAHQVLAHVRDAEVQAFAPRIRLLVDAENPSLESFDSEAWMAEHYDPQELWESILASLARARGEALARLTDLPPSGWNRSGFHPERGRRTLQWWVEYAVGHAQEHLRQLGG